MTNIIVHYLSRDGQVRTYIIETDARSLMYDDPLIEPVEVRAIAKKGLVIGRTDGICSHGYPRLTRSGMFIPPHRIVCIDFSDDCTD